LSATTTKCCCARGKAVYGCRRFVLRRIRCLRTVLLVTRKICRKEPLTRYIRKSYGSYPRERLYRHSMSIRLRHFIIRSGPYPNFYAEPNVGML
jgi:hypothetical protein